MGVPDKHHLLWHHVDFIWDLGADSEGREESGNAHLLAKRLADVLSAQGQGAVSGPDPGPYASPLGGGDSNRSPKA